MVPLGGLGTSLFFRSGGDAEKGDNEPCWPGFLVWLRGDNFLSVVKSSSSSSSISCLGLPLIPLMLVVLLISVLRRLALELEI